MLDLIYCSDNFATPLLSTVESISRKINVAAVVGSVATIRQLLEAQRLCCRIFYSLNFLDVPKKFEDKADEWMNEFKSYLRERSPGKIERSTIPNFEALTQFGTATITARNIGEVEASYSLTFDCSIGISQMEEQIFILKPKQFFILILYRWRVQDLDKVEF
ncbi:unnamed protein product [Lactuca virosa]|uniref:Generative cell specific-1/HAP2 domain-containing protein n=1 Tax=Lactuca virosa TaxID=75947 RepID=A0AAU9PT10_9ASTR|nr:unnamed protein product [Lactuca virosa]